MRYKLKDGKILKDGHTMFFEDVVKDLNHGSSKRELKECPVCGKGADIFLEEDCWKVACRTINCVILPPVNGVYFLTHKDAEITWNKLFKKPE